MNQMTVQRDWLMIDSTCIAVDAIDAFTASEGGGTVVFLRGGHVRTVRKTTPEFVDLLKNANRKA